MLGGFIAKLDLPVYIPKEEILRKQVFDAEIKFIGAVIDWTYSSDGTIKMVVKNEDDSTNTSILVPFFHIHRVGEHIILKVKRGELKSEFGIILNKVPFIETRHDLVQSTSRRGKPPPLFQ